MIAMLSRFFGTPSSEEVMGFLHCGLAVVPTLLLLTGYHAAAAVTMLLLLNVIIVLAIRSRENGDPDHERPPSDAFIPGKKRSPGDTP